MVSPRVGSHVMFDHRFGIDSDAVVSFTSGEDREECDSGEAEDLSGFLHGIHGTTRGTPEASSFRGGGGES